MKTLLIIALIVAVIIVSYQIYKRTETTKTSTTTPQIGFQILPTIGMTIQTRPSMR